MNVIALIGEPGTGKTTLMLELMEKLGVDSASEIKSEEYPLVTYHKQGHVYVLGKYTQKDSNKFSGTDRLSMAVQPQVCEWLKTLPEDSVVVFEGDRLGNQSFLMHCADKTNLKVFYLETAKAIREERYANRGSNQSQQFLKGRETKYAAIRTNFLLMPHIETLRNETPEDMQYNLKILLEEVEHAKNQE